MSTRSTISVLQENSSVKSIYCHWDGYLRGVGETLLNYYNTYERANALVSLGGLSCVYKNLNPLPSAPEAHYQGKGNPPIITTHSFDRPQLDVTVAYHRDRQKEFEQEVHGSLEEFKNSNNFQQYNYLFLGGRWYVMYEYYRDGEMKQEEWVELTLELIDKER